MIGNPQDIRIQKMMEVLKKLSLAEDQLDIAEAFLTGETEEASLDGLAFQDLSKTSQQDIRDFESLFYDLFRKGRKEEFRKLFLVVFAIGKSTSGALIPYSLMNTLTKEPELLPAPRAVSIFAEAIGNNQNMIQTYNMESLKRLAGTPETVREAMEYHKGEYANGELILCALYFLMKYPDVKPEKAENSSDGKGILQGITRMFGAKPPAASLSVAPSDSGLMKNYEDTILDSIGNLYSRKMPQSSVDAIVLAIRKNQITPQVRSLAASMPVSGFLLNLLGGCAFLNFALSATLKNIVEVLLAADLNGMLFAMEHMDLRMDLRVRGGDFDELFSIDPGKYISWAALRRHKNILKGQLARNQGLFLECCREFEFTSSQLLLSVIMENDPALAKTLESSEKGKNRLKIIDMLVPEKLSAYSEFKSYLRGELDITGLYPLEDKVAMGFYFGNYQVRNAITGYLNTYNDPEFTNRIWAYLVIIEAGYYLRELLNEKGNINQKKLKLFFHGLEQEKLDFAHQLKAVRVIYDATYTDSVKDKFLQDTVEIFRQYLKERPEAMKAAFKESGVVGRCLGLRVYWEEPEENREEILSYSQDTAKTVRELLILILKEQTGWLEDIKGLLASKKAAERELAIRTLVYWDKPEYKELLSQALEKEKNAKIRDLLIKALGTEESQEAGGSTAITRDDLVKELHKGGKKRGLAWAYETPFSPVNRVNGEAASEEYLQAILLCYSSMAGTLGVNKDAALLAEDLDAAQLAVYVNELFDKWLEAGAEAKKRWVLYAASIHGGADIVKKLQHHILEWPQHARGAIACDAVRALALNPLPQALLAVDGIARKFKFKQVKAAAGGALEYAASQLGLTREELADKIVPDLGFDENMERTFDYGGRRFIVTITTALEMEVRDDSGKKLKSLPAPGKRDDGEKADAAYEEFKQMKKQMKATVSSQKLRLEQALSTERQWKLDAWTALFVKNPVMHQFAIGLIWGLYEDRKLVQSFRYMEDGSFNTEEEDELTLPENGIVGLVHPVELSSESLKTWKEQLEDYEIIQPIEQLSRGVYHMTGEEADSKRLERFGGCILNDLSLMGKLQASGWYTGSVQDAGCFYTFYREDPELGIGVELHFSGTYIGGQNEEVTVYDARFYKAGAITRGSYVYDEADDKKCLFLKEIPARYFSEIILSLTRATASSKERDETWRRQGDVY